MIKSSKVEDKNRLCYECWKKSGSLKLAAKKLNEMGETTQRGTPVQNDHVRISAIAHIIYNAEEVRPELIQMGHPYASDDVIWRDWIFKQILHHWKKISATAKQAALLSKYNYFTDPRYRKALLMYGYTEEEIDSNGLYIYRGPSKRQACK